MIRNNLDIRIRDSVEDTLFALRWWLKETEGEPLEEMGAFFDIRLEDYPAHMYRWQEAYARFPSYLPESVLDILDLGCGSGLELDPILLERPDLRVTGIDLSEGMLSQLRVRHPSVLLIRGNYLSVPFGESCMDAVISFESLHHLLPGDKLRLYEKIRRCLKPDGLFLNCDYFACCEEEEQLLYQTFIEKKEKQGLPPGAVVHFDIPLTLHHEADLLEHAGFSACEALSSHSGACFLKALP